MRSSSGTKTGTRKREKQEEQGHNLEEGAEQRKNDEKSQRKVGAVPSSFEFYSRGGWHTFVDDQSEQLAEKLNAGLISVEQQGAKKKASEKRIRRNLLPSEEDDEFANTQFVIVPGKHWPKPARCTCCKGGNPSTISEQFNDSE